MLQKTFRCKRARCGKEFKPNYNGQVYCSKDCSPYGHFKDTEADFKKSKKYTVKHRG